MLGGGIGELWKNVQKVIETETEAERIVKEMQKTVLIDSESIMRRVLSGVVHLTFGTQTVYVVYTVKSIG